MSDAALIQVLIGVIVILICIIIGGMIWTIAREMFNWKSTNDQHDLLQQFNDTIKEQTKCIKDQFDDAERRIDRFEGINAGTKQELVNLIVATEQRIISSLRDILTRSQAVTIQNSTGGGAANQAGQNHHE